jgi:serine/threonine-protein kinase HipA
MVKELVVYLGGVPAGILIQSDRGNLSFSYDNDYRASLGATPVSLALPLSAQTHNKKQVLPFLSGLLPDSERALDSLAQRYRVSPANPFAVLENVGGDVAGALQVLPVGMDPPKPGAEKGTPQPLDSSEVGLMLRNVMAEYHSGVVTSAPRGHFSLAGAQPKIALVRVADAWALPVDGTPTTHILKPATGEFAHFDLLEHVTMSAARALGYQVADSERATIDGLDVFITTRYDRETVDGVTRRIHQEDMCQALAVSPQKKYQHRDGGPGIAAIAQLLSSLSHEVDRVEASRAFYEAFVFTIVTGCTDAHAKNYSLILEGDRVRLAPLYDLASYAGYWDRRSPVMSAMSVSGEYSLNKISAEMLASAGKQCGVGTEAAEIIQRVTSGVIEAFESATAGLALTAESEAFIGRLMLGLRALPLTATGD